jgi:serine protease inhibitor
MNDSANSLIAEAQADFAIKLLRDVSKGESTILSPISVAIALSMVYAGAKDETAEEMNKMLANGGSFIALINYNIIIH